MIFFRSYPELSAFLGIEMKRGLTRKGLRQAEIEFFLWGGCSLFPYVQVITDMEIGGAAFYQTASGSQGVLLGALQETTHLLQYCIKCRRM